METKTKNEKIIEIIRTVLLFSFFFLAVYNTFLGENNYYQMPRDAGFRKGIFFFLVAILIMRKVSVKKIEVWSTIAIGFLVLFIHLKTNNISSATYGNEYFSAYFWSRMAYVIFISLLVDLIRGRIKDLVRSTNVIWYISIILFIVIVVVRKADFYPIICPMIALLTTVMDKDDRKLAIDCYFMAFYLTFVIIYTRSFLSYRDNWIEGRYYGLFVTVEYATLLSASAFVIGLYFISRYLRSERKQKYKLILSIVLVVLPIVPIVISGARAVQVGLVFVVMGFFVMFVGNNKKKSMIIKTSVIVGVALFSIIGILLLSRIAQNQIENGVWNDKTPPYWYSHLAALSSPEYRKGYFGEDSFLNAIDRCLSDRLQIWDASLKMVKPYGISFDSIYVDGIEGRKTIDFSPHNFFIWMLLSYGAIIGGILIIWFAILLCYSAYRCYKKDNSMIGPFLWLLFCLGPFNGCHTLCWNELVGFTFLYFVSFICFCKRDIQNSKREIISEK